MKIHVHIASSWVANVYSIYQNKGRGTTSKTRPVDVAPTKALPSLVSFLMIAAPTPALVFVRIVLIQLLVHMIFRIVMMICRLNLIVMKMMKMMMMMIVLGALLRWKMRIIMVYLSLVQESPTVHHTTNYAPAM